MLLRLEISWPQMRLIKITGRMGNILVKTKVHHRLSRHVLGFRSDMLFYFKTETVAL